MTQDVRYAIRQLCKTPGFAAVAVLTLALGIGANTAVFSVMNSVLLSSLPVRNPQELVYLKTSDFPGGQTGYGDTSMRMQVYEALRKETRVFSDLMAWVPLSTSGSVPARLGSEPEELKADMVSGNFFTGLGVQAVRGRTFSADDETNHTQNAVLSYNYWTRRFGRSPAALGQTLYIKGVPFAIIGVAAPKFVGLDQGTSTDVWVPFQIGDDIKPWGASASRKTDLLYGGTWWFLLTVGRLQPGVNPRQAVSYLNPIFQQAAFLENPDRPENGKPPQLSFGDTRGMAGVRDDYEKPLRILMGMVLLVLIIACGNVAMLLVARNTARQREFSLRMALGGSRIRLFRQLLTESVVLVVSGSLLGWAFAIWSTEALARWSLLERSLAPDAVVLIFTAAVSVLAALVFGLAPLRTAVKIPIGLALKTSAATAMQDHDKHRSGQVMIALQMALCLVLLIGAGLLVRTLRNLETINTGMRTEGLLVFGVNPQQHARDNDEVVQFFQSLLDRLRQLPGIESATTMRNRIGSGWSSNTSVYVDGQKPKTETGSFAGVRWNAVAADFVHTLGTPLLLGRDITTADTKASPPVIVVNETFVKRYLRNSPPLGHQVGLNRQTETPFTIVGVIADIKYSSMREEARPMAFVPFTQVQGNSTVHVELRTAGNPDSFWTEVRRAMREFAPDVPLLNPITQQEQLSQSLSQERLFANLSLFFGLLAVLLVATGLYGTLAYKVARRKAEIGIRMALGAQQRDVLWMVLRESLMLSAFGVLVGLPAAIAGARLLRSMLFNLQPGDPLTFAGALVGIALVALVASFVPARRASSVDPMVALRSE
ncbi:MAG TPA: ABC transporter permease [Vicinamibacterales bacterium]